MIADSEFLVPGQPVKDSVVPRFHEKTMRNNFKSDNAKDGLPVYDTFDYVELLIIGDNKTLSVRKVQEADKVRWAPQWRAYKEGKIIAQDGTPLEVWPPIDKPMCEHFKHFNVRTVEQLAAVGDNVIQNLGMGARAMQIKAKAWMDEARNGSGLTKLAAENQSLKDDIAAMKDQMADILKAKAAEAAPPAQDLAAMVAAAVAAAMAPKAETAKAVEAPAKRKAPPQEGSDV